MTSNRLESGGGGLVASTHDYGRLMQMFLNGGEIAGHRILKPETVKLMRTNMIGNLHVNIDGTAPTAGGEAVGFGLDFAVYTPIPRRPTCPMARARITGAAPPGTWFWIDEANDLAFVGMIQNQAIQGQGAYRPGGMAFRADSAKLVYEALAPMKPAEAKPTAAKPAPAKVQ